MTFTGELEQELHRYPPTAWLIRNRYPLMLFTPPAVLIIFLLIVTVTAGNSNWPYGGL